MVVIDAAGHVCHCKRIGVAMLKQNPEVFHSRHCCFEDPFAPKAPRVFTPETIITERIPCTDPDEFEALFEPDSSHISVTLTLLHGSSHDGSSHDKPSFNQERQRRIRTCGRNQMGAS